MARSIPEGRLRDLVHRAAEIFIAQGYRRTQMEDVAEALGVAKGTLYGYVESKAALLDAALRFADGCEPIPGDAELPLATPRAGETLARVQARLASSTHGTELRAALERKRVLEPAAELAAIVGDLYASMSRNRRAIKLLDRCAGELPEFAAVWFGEGRWAQHAALAEYLRARIAKGHFRMVADVSVAARIILETIAFWAVHRHWDPSPQSVRDEEALATVLDILLHGLAKE